MNLSMSSNSFFWVTLGYRRLTEKKAFRGDIGIPRVLGMYENYPFWFTMLTELGFRVMISGRSNHDLFEKKKLFEDMDKFIAATEKDFILAL